MFRENAVEPSVCPNHFEASGFQPSSGDWTIRGFSAPSADSAPAAAGDDAGFLSERDAATYVEMSLAQLVGLRKFDLAMIEKGFKPHGPPPLWRGDRCVYARENLDEWVSSQSATYLEQRPKVRNVKA